MEKYIEAPSYLKRELAETVAILEIKQYQQGVIKDVNNETKRA